MSRIVCIVNQKGGVGKTSTAISLADALARAGKKTLLIDLDPQCNASTGLSAWPLKAHPLVRGTPFAESLVAQKTEGLVLLPGSRSFSDIEALTRDDPEQTARMRAQLQEECQLFDFVLIDCPPSLGHLTQIALSVSSEVLIPVQCEFFAMDGFRMAFDVIGKAMKERTMQERSKGEASEQQGDLPSNELEIGGILLTMFDASLELTYEVERQIRDFSGDVVFKTVIPRDVAVSEASGHGVPLLDYAPRSRGARAYMELCMEVLERG